MLDKPNLHKHNNQCLKKGREPMKVIVCDLNDVDNSSDWFFIFQANPSS